jgi:hypothetical protein
VNEVFIVEGGGGGVVERGEGSAANELPDLKKLSDVSSKEGE